MRNLDTKVALEIIAAIILALLVGLGPQITDCDSSCMASSLQSMLDR